MQFLSPLEEASLSLAVWGPRCSTRGLWLRRVGSSSLTGVGSRALALGARRLGHRPAGRRCTHVLVSPLGLCGRRCSWSCLLVREQSPRAGADSPLELGAPLPLLESSSASHGSVTWRPWACKAFVTSLVIRASRDCCSEVSPSEHRPWGAVFRTRPDVKEQM